MIKIKAFINKWEFLIGITAFSLLGWWFIHMSSVLVTDITVASVISPQVDSVSVASLSPSVLAATTSDVSRNGALLFLAFDLLGSVVGTLIIFYVYAVIKERHQKHS